MAVIRTELPHAHYTVMRNVWLRDPRLSLKAKGLLGYLLSHEVGYACSQAQMIRESSDGRDSVVSARDELAAAGYLRRTRARSTGGRFAEDDYELCDPFTADGHLIGQPAQVTQPAVGKPDRVGKPDAGDPQRSTRRIETNHEKNPAANAAGGSGGDAQLTVVDAGPTIGQRANALAREHYDAVGGLVPFMGVVNVVRKALAARGPSGDPYSDDAVRQALAELRERGRPVTFQSIGAALTHPGGVGRRAYAAAAPYRDPDPDAYTGAF